MITRHKKSTENSETLDRKLLASTIHYHLRTTDSTCKVKALNNTSRQLVGDVDVQLITYNKFSASRHTASLAGLCRTEGDKHNRVSTVRVA